MTPTDLDLDSIFKNLADPGIGANSASVMGMLKEFNKILEEVSSSFKMLNGMGVLTPIVRIASKKLEVDIDKPLPGTVQGIIPASDWHSALMATLNSLEPDAAVQQMAMMSEKLKEKAKEITEEV